MNKSLGDLETQISNKSTAVLHFKFDESYYIIRFFLASIYTACIIGGFCINGSIPLLYELTIECTYPIPETVSIGALSLVNNVFTFVFLLLLNVPSIGKLLHTLINDKRKN